MLLKKLLAFSLAVVLSGGLQIGVAFADQVDNNLTVAVDATAENLPLAVGASSNVTFSLVPQNGDGDNNCNIEGTESVTFDIVNSDVSKATTSVSSITWVGGGGNCNQTKTITVTALAAGTASITLAEGANNTGGTFDTAPAAFNVNVSAAPVLPTTATLIVKKMVVNDNGGTAATSSFSFMVNGGSAVAFESDGQNDLTVAPGTYSVTEAAAPGYAASFNNCTSVVLAAGDTATCVITNDDIAPKLTVTKVVTNDNGGTGIVSDFPLSVGATPVVSGAQNTFNAGSYTVSEVASSSYAGTITGDCAANGGITLNIGDVKSCTITNDDKPASVSGYKFYDINSNQVWDAGEPGLSGFTFNLAGPTAGSQATGLGGLYNFSNLSTGSYVLSETAQAGWTQTTLNPTFDLALGENKTNVNIGNSCLTVVAGGNGLGFWTNKNGQTLVNTADLAALAGLNLQNANGTDFNPTTYPQLKSWLSGAKATNMAYMLSAQLAALVLSDRENLDTSVQIVVPSLVQYGDTFGEPLFGKINSLGVITVADLISAADASLLANPNTTSPNPQRAYQEALKNAVEKVAGGTAVQLCQPLSTLKTFSASNSNYYNGPTNASPLYGTGSFSVTWDTATGVVTGGTYNEVVPATTGTTYFNIIGGTVTGNTFNLTFSRTNPNVYAFNGTLTLSGTTMTGTIDGPYYFEATGTVTP